MKIIIPMAGMGKRMRPHTLTTPKPLIWMGGKSIVEHLIDEISSTIHETIDEIAFIISPAFGKEVEQALVHAAEKLGAKGSIYYQEQALGTAHAILCAAPSLAGPVIVAFADTLFFANFEMGVDKDAIIWTKKVENPSAFGVVLTEQQEGKQKIVGFKEKPKEFVSDLAIIGIYYFKDGSNLKQELQYLIDRHIVKSGEYQLTDALQNMLDKGLNFYTETVDEWLDCGNVEATLQTHRRIMENRERNHFVSPSVRIENSVIIPPCHIADGVVLKNSVVGPCVSLGTSVSVENSVIRQSVVQKNAGICDAVLNLSMIGEAARVENKPLSLSISDYSSIQ